MKKIFIALLMLSVLNTYAQKASKLHRKAIIIDTHGDILSDQIKSGIDIGQRQQEGDFDLVRAREGGLDGQVFSVWSDANGDFALANRQIDSLDALIRRCPDQIVKVKTAAQLKTAVRKGKLAAMIGVEGGHMIENRPDNLNVLADRGMIYMTLTWNNSNTWSTSAFEETFKRDSLKQLGLTEMGKQVIRRMNDLGVIVDLSHVGESTLYDAIKASSKPVMASHSSAYAFNAHQRNLKDDQIRAIAKTGGVVFVNFYSGFIDSTYSGKLMRFNMAHKEELAELTKKYNSRSKASAEINQKYHQELEDMRPPLSLLIDHIDYMVKLVGANHVGLGADYDGAESYPKGLDDVRGYPLITEELLKRGYSGRNIKKILGGNFIRLLKANGR